MLEITVPGEELYNEETSEFIYIDDYTLQLEHSLVSISKWEAIWCKPFLNGKEKNLMEIIGYVQCMTINEKIDSKVYDRLTENNLIAINEYIDSPMTATTFREEKTSPSREIVTSELIYYWMVAYNIPFECECWHLNRLLTLIKVCNVKNNPPKQMSKQELMARNKKLNAERKQKLNSKG